MAYPTVLLHLDDDQRADVRNEQALRFAQHFGSHVNGLSCHRPVPAGADLVIAMGGLSDPLTDELQKAQAAALEREQRFRALCARSSVPSFETEIDDTEEPGRAMLKRAPLQDLVILGQSDPSEAGAARRRAVVEDVVLHSPRPSLLLPYAGRFDEFGRRPLIAWDGSAAAARAVSDALPLLKRSRFAHLVQIDRGAGDTGSIDQSPLDGIATWLNRHGIKSEAIVRYARGDVGNALLSHAVDVEADLLVMGSWGHARWTERLLGGATQTVMTSMTLPVLTSR
jgi:nucleotide-binding universal stress UspA family protein